MGAKVNSKSTVFTDEEYLRRTWWAQTWICYKSIRDSFLHIDQTIVSGRFHNNKWKYIAIEPMDLSDRLDEHVTTRVTYSVYDLKHREYQYHIRLSSHTHLVRAEFEYARHLSALNFQRFGTNVFKLYIQHVQIVVQSRNPCIPCFLTHSILLYAFIWQLEIAHRICNQKAS